MQTRLNEELLSDGSYKSESQSFASLQQSPYWNIFFLALAWALTLTTSTLLTSIGPLSATELGASKSIAAFTIGAFLIGAAVSSVPSGYIFRKYGRLIGFSVGCMCQIIGSILGVLALVLHNIPILFAGCFSIGLGQGLGQFYRFSAVEVSPDDIKPRAVTYVLSGGVLAAFLGPTSATYSVHLLEKEYLASFLIIGVIGLLNELVILCVRFPPTLSSTKAGDVREKGYKGPDGSTQNPLYSSIAGNSVEDGLPPVNPNAPITSLISLESVEEVQIRPMEVIIVQPSFIVACTIATLAHTVMVMIMSNVSLAMQGSGFSFSKSSLTLELHFLAMFSPGFFTGNLIQRFGTFIVALAGACIFAGSSLVLALGDDFWNYALGMGLNGLGWNFCFSAGTVMLTSCYVPAEASEVQAINDFILFSVAGGGSLISGVIYASEGWKFLIYIVSAMMGVYLALFVVMRHYTPDEDEDEDDDFTGSTLASNNPQRQKSHSTGGGIVGSLTAIFSGSGGDDGDAERQSNSRNASADRENRSGSITQFMNNMGAQGGSVRGGSISSNHSQSRRNSIEGIGIRAMSVG
mmetsp:Transcript_2140/g.3361  ORF Transcript_2140/g.3361 Transcript_2140/m.3361 type:complete len:577 (+) Transcript_2140:51-1781(+)